ncbi:MAG TPA: outer membrane protein transport protein, partial [Candidatus Nitrosotalea sp.]|nr:outer membrane protein transport protein [Candidatus Nitrosotalea sp.]
MKHTTRFTLIGSALACGAGFSGSAIAGGISLYEIATPDVGLASAGYSARAQDASTLLKNPAGMSELQGSQLQGGLQVLYGDVKFSPDSNTSVRLGTDDGGNAIGWLPGMSLFYVHDLGEKWRVGFGMFSNFGLAQKYDGNWIGRYYVQESTLIGISLMPSVSYQVNDWLSV